MFHLDDLRMEIFTTREQVKSTVAKRVATGKDREKLEKRILEELTKIFTETDSFFFCQTGDITNSLQRQCEYKKSRLEPGDQDEPLWRRVDDRFFWNKHMLRDIIDLSVSLYPTNFFHLPHQLLSTLCEFLLKLRLDLIHRRRLQTVGYYR